MGRAFSCSSGCLIIFYYTPLSRSLIFPGGPPFLLFELFPPSVSLFSSLVGANRRPQGPPISSPPFFPVGVADSFLSVRRFPLPPTTTVFPCRSARSGRSHGNEFLTSSIFPFFSPLEAALAIFFFFFAYALFLPSGSQIVSRVPLSDAALFASFLFFTTGRVDLDFLLLVSFS